MPYRLTWERLRLSKGWYCVRRLSLAARRSSRPVGLQPQRFCGRRCVELPLLFDVAEQLGLLKSVLHNWDDERCVQLLRRCRHAMAPQARLIVIERIASSRSPKRCRKTTVLE